MREKILKKHFYLKKMKQLKAEAPLFDYYKHGSCITAVAFKKKWVLIVTRRHYLFNARRISEAESFYLVKKIRALFFSK